MRKQSRKEAKTSSIFVHRPTPWWEGKKEKKNSIIIIYYSLMADKAYSHIYISNAEDNSYHLLLYDPNFLQISSLHGAPAPPTPPCTAYNSNTSPRILVVSIPAPSSFANSQPLPHLKQYTNTKVTQFLWLYAHCVLSWKKEEEEKRPYEGLFLVLLIYLIMWEERGRGKIQRRRRQQPPV